MSKNVAVLFSGGLDSTYLVWKNLMDGNVVYPIYIEIENNKNKTIIEKNRIELLRKKFDDEFGDNITNINYIINVGIMNTSDDTLLFKQIPVWLFGLMYIQGMDIDEIQIAYVIKDDAISYLDDIQNIYKSYQPICDEMIPLKFPLFKMMKDEMANSLPKEYLDLIYSCENPLNIGNESDVIISYDACCKCVPCKVIISSEYYGIGKFPKNYDNYLVEQYVYKLNRLGYNVVDSKGADYYNTKNRAVEPTPRQLTIDFGDDFNIDFGYELMKNDNLINYNG